MDELARVSAHHLGYLVRRHLTVAVGVAGLCFLAPGAPASAHPGRLGADGCHHVEKEFTRASGKVDHVGDHHCHRALGMGLTLDGKEQLEGAKHELHEPDSDTPSSDSRGDHLR
jgi:hypothetical protein